MKNNQKAKTKNKTLTTTIGSKETRTLSIIDSLYQKEEERKAQESTFTPVNVSLKASDVAMLSTIAKRFNQSRDMLSRDALSQAIRDMFSTLKPDERKLLAREADELTNSLAAEIAQENGFEYSDKDSTWVTEDRACVKAEKKLAKEMEAKKAVAVEESPEPESTVVEMNTEANDAEVSAEISSESVEATEEVATEEEEAKSIFG